MKKHYGHFKDLDLVDACIGNPNIEGVTITIPVTTDLLILDRHPLGEGRGFYADGFTLVFEGVTRSVRDIYDYDENGNFVGEKRIVEDGPFPPAKAPVNQHDMIFVTDDRKQNIDWIINAETFYLIEPDGPWEKHRAVSPLRDDPLWQ